MSKRHPNTRKAKTEVTASIVTSARDETTGDPLRPALTFNVTNKIYRQLEKRAAAEGITLDELAYRAVRNLLLKPPLGHGLN
jgi:hypothetical protein